MNELIFLLCNISLAVIFLIYLLIRLLINYINYNTKSKVDEALSNAKHVYKNPSVSPAEVGLYVNNKKLSRKERLATVLDLVARGYVEIIKSKDNNFYNYKLVSTEKDKYGLNNHELLILSLLEEPIDFVDLERSIKETRKKTSYLNKFENYVFHQKDKVKSFENTRNKKFYDIELKIRKIIFVISIIPVAHIALPLLLGEASTLVYGLYVIIGETLHIFTSLSYFEIYSSFIFLPSFILIIIVILKSVHSYLIETIYYYSSFSTYKNDDYKEWIGFKRSLKKCDKIPGFITGENMLSYYAYALVFDCNKSFLRRAKKSNLLSKEDLKTLEYFSFLAKKMGKNKINYRENVRLIDIISDNFGENYFN